MSDTEQEIAEQMTPDAQLGPDDATDAAEPGTLQHPEGEPIEAAPAVRSQAQIDKMMSALQKQAEKHATAVARIMGDDFAMLVPSPVDWTPGFIFNVPEMQPTPEQVAELHALLGGAAPVELQAATDAEGCDTCKALGQVLTGSRVPGQETKPCGDCQGSGWRHKMMPVAPVQQLTATHPGFSQAVPMEGPIQVADQWGRPFGHRDYGLSPAQVGA